MAQRVDPGAPIAHLLGQLYSPPEGGLRLVGAARKVQRGSIDAVGAGLAQRRFAEIEGDRSASGLKRRGDFSRLEGVNRAQHDDLSADGATIRAVGRGWGFDCLEPLGRVIELTNA